MTRSARARLNFPMSYNEDLKHKLVCLSIKNALRLIYRNATIIRYIDRATGIGLHFKSRMLYG